MRSSVGSSVWATERSAFASATTSRRPRVRSSSGATAPRRSATRSVAPARAANVTTRRRWSRPGRAGRSRVAARARRAADGQRHDAATVELIEGERLRRGGRRSGETSPDLRRDSVAGGGRTLRRSVRGQSPHTAPGLRSARSASSATDGVRLLCGRRGERIRHELAGRPRRRPGRSRSRPSATAAAEATRRT